ncbi:hypothetical protein [Rhizobium sp. Root1204]|uniref:hypothetical protein n=1 Tax=Rhizobium sp. Root1204 TaxID=1736428 RepID=UPI000A7D4159|nr:hypothetical protein [Rhizobium sp. Root1204]
MPEHDQAVTPLKDVIVFAKKHRIAVEDAQKILDQYGDEMTSKTPPRQRAGSPHN